jgi:hypothetical protein
LICLKISVESLSNLLILQWFYVVFDFFSTDCLTWRIWFITRMLDFFHNDVSLNLYPQ